MARAHPPDETLSGCAQMVVSGVALIHMPRIVERTATYLDNEMKTIEELLIELDYAGTELAAMAASVIRMQKLELELVKFELQKIETELCKGTK